MSRKKLTEDGAGWAYLVDQGEIGQQPYHKSIVAGEADLKAIADRLGIPGVHSLSSDVVMHRVPGNKAVIHVEGVFKADVTQSCIISQAPVRGYIEEEFETWFADKESFVSLSKARHDRAGRENDTEIQILNEQEDPEPIINGKIDLGDLVSQYLSLSLNPYPRAHGVEWQEESVENGRTAEPETPLRKNPFDALKDWKMKGKDKKD